VDQPLSQGRIERHPSFPEAGWADNSQVLLIRFSVMEPHLHKYFHFEAFPAGPTPPDSGSTRDCTINQYSLLLSMTVSAPNDFTNSKFSVLQTLVTSAP
jgi:hypothetical protein